MNKLFKRYTLRTEDKRRMAVLKPLVHPFQATERLCQYEETGLSPEAVQRLQLLWRTLLTEITSNAQPLQSQPGVLGFTLTEDLRDTFKAELEGKGMRSDDGVLITQPVKPEVSKIIIDDPLGPSGRLN
jgi:hypothetical protein